MWIPTHPFPVSRQSCCFKLPTCVILNLKDLVKIVRWDLSNYHALKAIGISQAVMRDLMLESPMVCEAGICTHCGR